MTWFDHVRRDVRFGARLIARERARSTVVIAILALAVAANTAIYSVVDAVMFRPLPYKDPDELVVVSRVIGNAPAVGTVAHVHFDEWRRSAGSFASLALLTSPTLSVTGSAEPENVAGARVSATLFSMLGVGLQMGRGFTQDEEDRHERVAVVSDEFWRRRFAARPDAIGESINVNASPTPSSECCRLGFRSRSRGLAVASTGHSSGSRQTRRLSNATRARRSSTTRRSDVSNRASRHRRRRTNSSDFNSSSPSCRSPAASRRFRSGRCVSRWQAAIASGCSCSGQQSERSC